MKESFEHDQITHRLVIALDALPVPEEPTGLRATASPSLARDLRMLLAAALLLVLVTTLASPQFRQAAAELTRYTQRPGSGMAWVGYYHDHTRNGPVPVRLLIASGGASGQPTTPEIVGNDNVYIGQWSPDRQQITMSNGNQLYVGDQLGRFRPIADVTAGYVIRPLGWIGNDNVLAVVDAPTSTHSLVNVDVRTGSFERRELDNLPRSPGAPMSPNGRWLTIYFGPPGAPADRCGWIGEVYDLVARQVVEVVDANSRSALAFGFLSDGRLVIGQCDVVARTLEIYVGVPGVRPSLIAVVPTTVSRPWVALGSDADEIFVIASGPESPQQAYVFDPSGRLLRRTPLPQLASKGPIGAGLSSDGRFMSFDVTAFVHGPSGQDLPRSGVVDLTTGQVTYLCDGGCDYLYLR